MAISVSEKFRGSLGGKAFRCFEITLPADATAVTITAGSLGLHYIDHAMAVLGTKGSAVGDFNMPTAHGSYILPTFASSTNTGDTLELWTVGF